MVGTFLGKRYRVAGRSVMGMEQEGETYHWNEFNLVSDAGEAVTLVYEETERGGQWRLFTMFEPRHPMTAQEAAAKQVGDTVNLDGTPGRVTLVDESRVEFIEGEGPEGQDVGDVARYFNADAGGEMLVASWTGDDIEFYRGVDLPRETVMAAFGIRRDTAPVQRVPQPSGRDSSTLAGWAMKIVVLILLIALYLAGYSSRSRSFSGSITSGARPSPAPLAVGSTGALEGARYRITGHALVEIAAVGLRYVRHEYDLVDQDGNKRLLVCGSKPADSDWLLFTPFQPPVPLTPPEAAAKCAGDPLELAGHSARVTGLFRSKILRTEPVGLSDTTAGAVFYGFNAQAGPLVFLARWNEHGIAFHRGKAWPAKDLTAVFKTP